MSRAHLDYSAGRPAARAGADAQDVSTPTAGFFRFRLRAGSVIGGVRLWHGPPLDPIDGSVLDRSWRWMAEFDGEPIDFERVWPACTGQPITEAEYRQLVARREWARREAPGSAYAEPGRKVDFLSRKTPLNF